MNIGTYYYYVIRFIINIINKLNNCVINLFNSFVIYLKRQYISYSKIFNSPTPFIIMFIIYLSQKLNNTKI